MGHHRNDRGEREANRNSRIDRDRLRHDRDYMLATVCNQFERVDKYNRGLITSACFSTALEDLGLRHGQKEVEDVLQFCTFTHDGFVYYKDLKSYVSPNTPRAKRSSLRNTIYPADEESRGRAAQSSEGLVVERSEDIRKLYSKWERSFLTNEQFKAALEDMGLRLTTELDTLLINTGHARQMPFSKLMYALQADENDGRRARNHSRSDTTPPRARRTDHTTEKRRAYNTVPTENVSLRQAIVEFIDGTIPSIVFRGHLQKHGVAVNSHLERLIRTHESDNSVRFQDMARVVLKDPGSASKTFQNEDSHKDGGSSARSLKHEGSHRDGRPNPHGAAPGPSISRCRSAPRESGGGGYSRERTSKSAAGIRYDPNDLSPPWATGNPERAVSGYPVGVQPPWADGNPERAVSGYPGGVDPPWASGEPVEERPHSRLRKTGNSRAMGDHGKITHWQGPEQGVPPRPRVIREVNDCLNWNVSTSRQYAVPNGWDREDQFRFGKRIYGQAPPAGDVAPFGRNSDLEPAGTHQQGVSAPFGTDRDRLLKRPEDAGTNEYRTVDRNFSSR